MRLRFETGLIAFALCNTVLYSLLLPLWEGFDEPFHYGYVEALATRHVLPRLGKTPISAEIVESLRLAPASPAVRHNLPFVSTYSEFQALPAPERAARRHELMNLPPALRAHDAPDSSNYEAQQAPLAYALLAPANLLWASLPLPARILRLRILCGAAACLLQFAATLALAWALGLGVAARRLALFLTLSAQMFYASVAHVANDWLAIPLSTAVCAAALSYWREPRRRGALLLGGAVALGLLTKAYFLAWLVFAAAIVLWTTLRRHASWICPALFTGVVLAFAGPWYARNLALYGSLSAMQVVRGRGTSSAAILHAAWSLPWHKVVPQLLKMSLWTGNNSFTSFSAATEYVILALLGAGFVLWLRSSRKPPEGILAAGCLVFVAGQFYAMAAAFAFTNQTEAGPLPWYTQAIAAPLACLLCLGLGRSGSLGYWIGVALALSFAYLLAATYVVKLIPLYAGCVSGRMTPASLYGCYLRDPAAREQMLAQTALGPPAAIMALTAAVVVMSVIGASATFRRQS